MELRKIFSQVSTYQGPILTLVYLWDTNIEHNGEENKINSFMHIRTHPFIYIIYLPIVLKERLRKCILLDKNIPILFYEQAVYRSGLKMEKGLLDKCR